MVRVKKSIIPDIFEYTDYRAFLRDLYAYLKAKDPGKFSFRYFSRQAGFVAPNFLKLVMDGKRNLSAESTEQFVRALKLPRDEARFFQMLVLLNQSKTAAERELHARQLFRSRRFRRACPLAEAQYNYYTQWYFVPIRELVPRVDFREDPAWIAKQLDPPIEPEGARRALEELTRLGLIRRDARGKLVQAEAVVETEDLVVSSSIARFHREMLRLAGESIERFKAPDRELSSATIGVSVKNAERITKLMRKFRREILRISAEEQPVERVFQVGLQIFPLSTEAPGATRGEKGDE